MLLFQVKLSKFIRVYIADNTLRYLNCLLECPVNDGDSFYRVEAKVEANCFPTCQNYMGYLFL